MRLLPIFRKDRFTCNVSLSPDDVRDYMMQHTAFTLRKRLFPGDARLYYDSFYSVIFKRYFCLWQQPRSKNIYFPVFYGKIVPTDSGSRIIGFFSLHWTAWFLFIVMNAFIFTHAWPYLYVGAFFLICVWLFSSESRVVEIKTFLERIDRKKQK
jgi:hypothetical protein